MLAVSGNIAGLSARELQTLSSLEKQRVPVQNYVSRELAHRMTAISDALHRKVAVLLNRAGHVESIMLGDAQRVFLSDIGRSRVAKNRLRGVRLIVTALDTANKENPELITNDELTDLIKLRLDMVVSIECSPIGAPGRIQFAHLKPGEKNTDVEKQTVRNCAELPTQFLELMHALEEEFKATSSVASTTKKPPAILVHVNCGEKDARERCAEMLDLCTSAGVEIVHIIEQRRREPDPRSVIGKGKLEELELLALDLDAEFVIFDRELSPSQSRVISNTLPLKVIDRTQLILDIFAQRATSLDGKLQVELAQLKYNLPKLVQKDTAMSRLTGGVGGRGPGETKLEINRRRARERMNVLEKCLKDRETHRKLQRKRRNEQHIPIFSLIGYTNAGKSTLLNTLTNSDVYAENKLFATLDTTSRRLRFPKLQEVIFTDTVGFIRDLPKDLVAAFKATLEELDDADALLHVIDASSPQIHSQIASVEKIVADLNLQEKPLIRVLNKCDLLDPAQTLELVELYNAIPVSALYRSSTLPLLDRLQQSLEQPDVKITREED